MTSLGIDLAGKEENPTGVSILENHKIKSSIMHSNNEIIQKCESINPNIVAIDAPLNFPKEEGLRECDLKLIKRGHRVLPPTLGGMKVLTERGIQLSEKIRKSGFKVIEIHPRTSGVILFDSESKEDWVSTLSSEGWSLDLGSTEHELDSTLAAITGFLHLAGKTEKIGNERGTIIIPSGRLKAL